MFFNEKYLIIYNPNTPDINCKIVYFLLKNRFLKIIGAQYLICIFFSDLTYNMY